MPQLTPAKLLLGERTPESLEKARSLLDPLDELLRRTHRTTVLIDVLALQALVLDAQGDESAAVDKLAEAVALAEPGGVVRSFLDLGAPLVGLLRRLAAQADDASFIRSLLAGFEHEGVPAPDGQTTAATGPPPSPDGPPLLDALTHRELEVLELLARRLRDKEIAEELLVSPETVNSHLKHVYSKLDVRGRRQAVSRASELGILRPA